MIHIYTHSRDDTTILGRGRSAGRHRNAQVSKENKVKRNSRTSLSEDWDANAKRSKTSTSKECCGCIFMAISFILEGN